MSQTAKAKHALLLSQKYLSWILEIVIHYSFKFGSYFVVWRKNYE